MGILMHRINVASAIFTRFGFSQQEAANCLGVRVDTVKKWMSGKMVMPDDLRSELVTKLIRWEVACDDLAGYFQRVAANGHGTFFYILEPNPETCRVFGLPSSKGFWRATLGRVVAKAPGLDFEVITDEEHIRLGDEAHGANSWAVFLSDRKLSLTMGGSDWGAVVTDAIFPLIEAKIDSDVAAQDYDVRVDQFEDGHLVSIGFFIETQIYDFAPGEHYYKIHVPLLNTDTEFDLSELPGSVLFVSERGDDGANANVWDDDDWFTSVCLNEDPKDASEEFERSGAVDYVATNIAIEEILTRVFKSPKALKAWAVADGRARVGATRSKV